MSQSDDQGRSEPTTPGSGSTPPYGRPQYGQQGQPQYGQQPWTPDAYGQPGQQPYGQPGYDQPAYDQPAYAQQYGEPQYGQPYGPAYGQYGSGQPAKPGSVVTAAVLGFVFGALGVIFTLLLFVAGSATASLFGGISEDDDVQNGIFAIVVLFGLLTVGWTVATIWGSVWALTGRSRVLLIVAGSVALGSRCSVSSAASPTWTTRGPGGSSGACC